MPIDINQIETSLLKNSFVRDERKTLIIINQKQLAGFNYENSRVY